MKYTKHKIHPSCLHIRALMIILALVGVVVHAAPTFGEHSQRATGADDAIDDPIRLFMAVAQGDINAIQIAFQWGTNPNIQNEVGDTPLHIAVQRMTEDPPNNHPWQEIISILLERRANPFMQNHMGLTPYDLASNLADHEIQGAMTRSARRISPTFRDPPLFGATSSHF